MKRSELPLVEGTIIQDDCIGIGSDEWYKWLETHKSFHYEPRKSEGTGREARELNGFTVRNRAANYWYAYRKIGTEKQVRQYYLGKTSELSYEKLQNAASELSIPEYEYAQLLKRRREVVQAEKDKKCTITTQDSTNCTSQNMYNQSQATELQDENASLKTQVAELQKQLAAERDDYRRRLEETQAEREQLTQLEAIQHERDNLQQWQEKYKPVLLRCKQLRDDLHAMRTELKKPDKECIYPKNSKKPLKDAILAVIDKFDKGAAVEP